MDFDLDPASQWTQLPLQKLSIPTPPDGDAGQRGENSPATRWVVRETAPNRIQLNCSYKWLSSIRSRARYSCKKKRAGLQGKMRRAIQGRKETFRDDFWRRETASLLIWGSKRDVFIGLGDKTIKTQWGSELVTICLFNLWFSDKAAQSYSSSGLGCSERQGDSRNHSKVWTCRGWT